MPEKIGFVTFRMFDGVDTREYAALKNKPMRAGQEVKLADLHPSHKDYSAIGKTTDYGPTSPKFRSELLVSMNEFYRLYFRASIEREVIERWYQRQKAMNAQEFVYWRRLDLLYAWIEDKRIQHVYTELGGRMSIFKRAAEKVWMETSSFEKVRVVDWGRAAIRTAQNIEKQVPFLNTEDSQIFTNIIMLKHTKWIAARAYSKQIAHGHRVFSDVSNGIVGWGGPARPHVPYIKMPS